MKKSVKLLVGILSALCVTFTLFACVDVDANKVHSVTFPTETVGYTITGEAGVVSGEDYTFNVAIHEGYEKGENFAVKVNGEEVAILSNGDVTVSRVLEDLVVTVEGVIRTAYSVNLVAGDGYILTGEEVANQGDTYEFSVAFAEGYEADSDFAVMVNGLVVEAVSAGNYQVANVNSDITVTVKGFKLKEYTISYVSGTGLTVSGPQKVTHGDSAVFQIVFDAGYEAGANTVALVNSKIVEIVNDTITVQNVKEDLTVSVNGASICAYSITLTEGAGYTLTGDTLVEYGANAQFTFALLEGYEKTADFAVMVNGEEVDLDADGKATIQNVTEKKTVTVKGVQRISFAVALSSGAGYTLTGDASVYYGDNYVATFALAEGYEKTAGFAVKVNGSAVEVGANGEISVANVKNALDIAVEGVQRISFAVTLTAGEGYALTGDSSVYYGDSYTFTFAFLEGYQAAWDFVVKVNGSAVEVGANGEVTVENVKGELVITVVGVEVCPETKLEDGEIENDTQWWK